MTSKVDKIYSICKSVIDSASKTNDIESNRAKIRCLGAIVSVKQVNLQQYSDDALSKLDFDMFETFFAAKTYIKVVKAFDDCRELKETLEKLCNKNTSEEISELTINAITLAKGLEKPISDQLENFEVRLSELDNYEWNWSSHGNKENQKREKNQTPKFPKCTRVTVKISVDIIINRHEYGLKKSELNKIADKWCHTNDKFSKITVLRHFKKLIKFKS